MVGRPARTGRQIAIRAMDLHAVESGCFRVFGTLAVRLDDAGDFASSSARGTDRASGGRSCGTWPSTARALERDRRAPLSKRIRDAADMPELQQHQTAGFMYRARHSFQPATCSLDHMPGVSG